VFRAAWGEARANGADRGDGKVTQSGYAQRDDVPVAATGTGTGRERIPVAVVGAGPYGLSVAAHLRAAGVPVRVFGEVMGSWRHAMSTGVFVKSAPAAVGLSAPAPVAGLEDFCRARGDEPLTELTPIPCTTFVDYGEWFRERHVGEVDPARVTAVERDGRTLVVRTDDGRECAAAAVVIATGLNGLAEVPGTLAALAPEGPHPAALVSHTSQHQDLARYAGQRVAVVGGGQSALESAALLHELGADPVVLVRQNHVLWGGRPELHRSSLQRMTRPRTTLGNGWGLMAVSRAPGAMHRLPSSARAYLLRRLLLPAGGWWLRDRVEGVVQLRVGCRVVAAEDDGAGRARLHLAEPGGTAELAVDHVLAATGYRLDLDALGYLTPALRAEIRRAPGSRAPLLSPAFESSVRGLFFSGSLAAPSFGPVLRFVAGAEFTAARIARHAARRAAAG